jgi:hypothetical protein
VETSSPRLRAKTTSVAVTIQYLTGILFVSCVPIRERQWLIRTSQSYTVPLMLSNQNAGWGQKTGLFFAGTCGVYLIPCIFLFPETKNRTYAELDELYERGIPAWKFATTKTAYNTEIEHQEREK